MHLKANALVLSYTLGLHVVAWYLLMKLQKMARIVSLQANVWYGSRRERCIDGGFVSLSCVCSFLEHLNVAYQRVFIVSRHFSLWSGPYVSKLPPFFVSFFSIYCEHIMILYTKEPLHPLWAGSCTSWFRTRVSYAVLYITFRWHVVFNEWEHTNRGGRSYYRRNCGVNCGGLIIFPDVIQLFD